MNYADELRSLFEDHLYKNLNQYVDSKINASQRRFLLAKWVWEALSKVGKMKDSIIRSFKKCGLLVALVRTMKSTLTIWRNSKCHQPLCMVLDDDDEFEKQDEDKVKDENEERFEILFKKNLSFIISSQR